MAGKLDKLIFFRLLYSINHGKVNIKYGWRDYLMAPAGWSKYGE